MPFPTQRWMHSQHLMIRTQQFCSRVKVFQSYRIQESPLKKVWEPTLGSFQPQYQLLAAASERESLTQVVKTTENMTWERLSCLALQH